jgi:hypothetical protein
MTRRRLEMDEMCPLINAGSAKFRIFYSVLASERKNPVHICQYSRALLTLAPHLHQLDSYTSLFIKPP